MSYPLKFRVWHKQRKRYLKCSDASEGECDDLAIDLEGKLFLCDEGNGPRELDRRSNFIIELWTGLVDKNGVDIYEGDLVDFETPKITHGPDREEYKKGEVWYDVEIAAWTFGRWNWPGIGSQSGLTLNDRIDSDSFEVVGNIHEQ